VVVDNRVGALGAFVAQAVAQTAPDGHTLLLAAAPFTSVAPALPGAGYQPLTGFAPEGMIAQAPLVCAANNVSPANSLPELVGMSLQRRTGCRGGVLPKRFRRLAAGGQTATPEDRCVLIDAAQRRA